MNERIAEAIERAELDTDQEALFEKLLGKDYEVITADDRLEKIAQDMVEHCTTRWRSRKAMLVCSDKTTCVRMLKPQALFKTVRPAGLAFRSEWGSGRV